LINTTSVKKKKERKRKAKQVKPDDEEVKEGDNDSKSNKRIYRTLKVYEVVASKDKFTDNKYYSAIVKLFSVFGK